MGIFTSSKPIKEYRCRDLRHRNTDLGALNDRQKRVPGFCQEALDRISIAVIGAGGLGGEFVRGSVKKGIGKITIYDGDDVELSNLNRQFFTPNDVGHNKSYCLTRNASRAGFLGSQLIAVPYFFQAAVERTLVHPCHLVFCGVDNDDTRIFVARYFRDIPVIFAAVGSDAGHGYTAVQQPGNACFGCFQPQALVPEKATSREEGACPVDPAILDVLGVVAMLALYAVDSLVMNRPRRWNYKQIALHGNFPDINTILPKRPGCPICSSDT